jgi:hypothetical protein
VMQSGLAERIRELEGRLATTQQQLGAQCWAAVLCDEVLMQHECRQWRAGDTQRELASTRATLRDAEDARDSADARMSDRLESLRVHYGNIVTVRKGCDRIERALTVVVVRVPWTASWNDSALCVWSLHW